MTPTVEPATSPGLLGPGTRLGRYQIIRRLATGGMAELYLARHVAAGGYQKVVALKRVRPHLAEDQGFVGRFMNEARLAAGLDHSNIAHVIDFGVERGEHFMAMEYVHGRSVLQLLQQFEACPLPLSCALMIVRDVAAALHHAHERRGPDGRALGLVHRDVSPSNVLVSFDGDVKLVDFGIAKATAESNATRTGTILGKLSYMAPEQLRGHRIDRRSDVFALCTVAYELMTGVRCFYAEGEFALINRVVAGRFDRPSTILDDFPPALERILVKGLAAAPEARFDDARELQLALEAFATEAGLSLSKLELAAYMRRAFGEEEYPRTDVVPVPTAAVELASVAAQTSASTSSKIRIRRSLVVWVCVASVAGVVVGLGMRGWMQRVERTPAPAPAPASEPTAPAPATALPPVPAEVEPDRKATSTTATPPSSDAPVRSRVAPPERRTRGTAPAPKKPRGTAPPRSPDADDPALRDFLPPSRRADGG